MIKALKKFAHDIWLQIVEFITSYGSIGFAYSEHTKCMDSVETFVEIVVWRPW